MSGAQAMTSDWSSRRERLSPESARAKAARCRKVASVASEPAVAAELLDLARRFDEAADALDQTGRGAATDRGGLMAAEIMSASPAWEHAGRRRGS